MHRDRRQKSNKAYEQVYETDISTTIPEAASLETLEKIVNSWSTTKKSIKLKQDRLDILTIMYNNSKETLDTSMLFLKILEKTNMQLDEAESILQSLCSKNLIAKRHDSYKLLSDGYEVFETEAEILERMVTQLSILHADQNWIGLPKIAKRAGFGEFRITCYYLRKLEDQGVVEIDRRERKSDKKNFTKIKFTTVGKCLVDYLRH